MKTKLKSVGLFVKDLSKMVSFYRDVVGFDLKWDGVDPSVIIELDDGLRFMLFGREDFEEITNTQYTYPTGLNGSFQLALDVETEEEVDHVFAELVKGGARSVCVPHTYPWGLRSSYVADPEGNLIEIATWKGATK